MKLFFLLIGDITLFFLSLFFTLSIRYSDRALDAFMEHLPAFVVMFLIYEVVLFSAGFWDKRFTPTSSRVFNTLLPVQAISMFLMASVFYAFPVYHVTPKTNLLLFSVILFGFMYLWRVFGTRILTLKYLPVLMIGKDEFLEGRFKTKNLWGIRISDKVTKLEGLNNIKEILDKNKLDTVIVDIDSYPRIDVLYRLIFENINIIDAKTLKEEIRQKVDLTRIDQLWFIQNTKSKEELWASASRRLIDMMLSLPLLLIYFLIYPVLAYLIKKDGGPALFEMERVGLGGKIFTIKKFRSMTPDLEGEQKNIDHKKEVTKIGEFIRKSSLDEFPQVLSILKGDMSFVGPRPEIPELVEKYEKEIKHYSMRHMVKPGLSGWAQIKQKAAPHHTQDSDLTAEKLSYDLYYIKNHSVFLYVKICLKTLSYLFNRTNQG